MLHIVVIVLKQLEYDPIVILYNELEEQCSAVTVRVAIDSLLLGSLAYILTYMHMHTLNLGLATCQLSILRD